MEMRGKELNRINWRGLFVVRSGIQNFHSTAARMMEWKWNQLERNFVAFLFTHTVHTQIFLLCCYMPYLQLFSGKFLN